MTRTRVCSRGWAWCTTETPAEEENDPATRGAILHSSGQLSTVVERGTDHPVTLTIGNLDGEDESMLTVAGAYLNPAQARRYARDLRRAAIAAQGGPGPVLAAAARRVAGAVGAWLVRATGLRLVRVRVVEVDPRSEHLPGDNVIAFEAGRACGRAEAKMVAKAGGADVVDRRPHRPGLRVVRGDGPPDAS